MMAAAKAWIARRWPVLRLRTILFGTLLFVAALPGFGAVFLRVYENALVRRTEAELVAQAAALAASAGVIGQGMTPRRAMPPAFASDPDRTTPDRTTPDRTTEVDLQTSPVLPPRPAASAPHWPADPQARALARRMMPIFDATRRTTFASILMLDSHGVVLNGPDRGRGLAALAEVRAAIGGRAVTVLREDADSGPRYPLEWLSRAAHIRLHHARPVLVDGQHVGLLLVSRAPRALFLGIYEDRGKIAVGVATIFLLLLLLSAILSRAIVRPIEGLSRATRALALGRRAAPRTPSLQVVEIQALYRDFEQMAEAIEKRSRYLRDFASAVSHEFKTPLAGISGAIELLQDHGDEMVPADRARFLANMGADAQRLSRLVRRLMELARADVTIGESDAAADAGPVAAAVADALGSAEFTILVQAAHPPARIAIDADALEAVLTMLAENARQAGASRLTIGIDGDDRSVSIDLVDDGPGIPPGDRDRIFHPFFTSKRAQGGTGLGLAIARSLLEAYRGDVWLMPSPQGAHFRLICPRGR